MMQLPGEYGIKYCVTLRVLAYADEKPFSYEMASNIWLISSGVLTGKSMGREDSRASMLIDDNIIKPIH